MTNGINHATNEAYKYPGLYLGRVLTFTDNETGDQWIYPPGTYYLQQRKNLIPNIHIVGKDQEVYTYDATNGFWIGVQKEETQTLKKGTYTLKREFTTNG